MYYDIAQNNHGLPHNPFKACVVPRPIGWISTVGADGVGNIGPYSFFNAVASEPPVVMYASNGVQPHGPKDTLTNVEATGEFVVNVATWDLRDAMNRTSLAAAPHEDEFVTAGLTPAPCRIVKAPRIAEAPINMECVYLKSAELPSEGRGRNVVVFGQVVGVHIREDVLTDGKIDIAKLRPISRLGYRDYAVISETFTMNRPGGGDQLAGL